MPGQAHVSVPPLSTGQPGMTQHPRQSVPQCHGHITQYAGCFALQADALLSDVAGQGLLDQASKAQQLLAQVSPKQLPPAQCY
jgi:hypothetical protein